MLPRELGRQTTGVNEGNFLPIHATDEQICQGIINMRTRTAPQIGTEGSIIMAFLQWGHRRHLRHRHPPFPDISDHRSNSELDIRDCLAVLHPHPSLAGCRMCDSPAVRRFIILFHNVIHLTPRHLPHRHPPRQRFFRTVVAAVLPRTNLL